MGKSSMLSAAVCGPSLNMTPAKTQVALIMQGEGKAFLCGDLSIPRPGPGQILVRTHAVALNPSDWMALEYSSRAGAGLGFDFGGTVVELGSNTSYLWDVGDRVAGMVHGSLYTQGAFREYLLTDAELVVRIPAHVSLAEASTIGMGVSTASQALYQSLSLPPPEAEPKLADQTILVYGGSTSTGSLAIQLAKLSGYRVITTCSARNKSWLLSLQADEAIDYTEADAVTSVRDAIGPEGLTKILDCIAKPPTTAFCYQCFTPPERQTLTAAPTYTYATLMPVDTLPPVPKSLRPGSIVVPQMNLVYTIFGRSFCLLGKTWEPSPPDREFMARFYRRTEDFLSKRKLHLMPLEIMQGGLAALPQGITQIKDGKIHGKKLVYMTTLSHEPCYSDRTCPFQLRDVDFG